MSRPDRLQTEQERHPKACALYLSLGEARTYRQVAARLGVSVSSVKAWARRENWKQRLYEHDAQEARQLADRSLQEVTTETERNLKIVRLALVKLAKDIHEGRIKGVISDVDRMVRLEEHLRGQDGSACRDPAHRLVADIQAMQDPEAVKRIWIQSVLNMRRLWPEAMDVLAEVIAKDDRPAPVPPRPIAGGDRVPLERQNRGRAGSEKDSRETKPPDKA